MAVLLKIGIYFETYRKIKRGGMLGTVIVGYGLGAYTSKLDFVNVCVCV